MAGNTAPVAILAYILCESVRVYGEMVTGWPLAQLCYRVKAGFLAEEC